MDEEQLQQQQPKAKDNFRRWGDPLFDDLRRIFSRAKLREVLTHSSFYEQEGRGNSRHVFAGMFVFKGQVAEVLFRYAVGEGTRLQHILGNLFRNERLERQFDEWHLGQFARAGENFDIKTHKHMKEQRKAEARERDAKRRVSQAAAKIRKAENARRAAIKAAKEARPMSAKKRRFLEDKKK